MRPRARAEQRTMQERHKEEAAGRLGHGVLTALGRGLAADKESGMALIVVLWVLAFLMFIVVEFSYTMRVETETVRNMKDEASARYLALAGVNMALAEIGSPYDIVFLENGRKTVLGVKERHDIKAIDVQREFALGDGFISYSITDEEGKLNINRATRAQIADLLRTTGIEMAERDEIADSILDWRDKNHVFHMNGAEDDYYASLPHPYGARDGDFETTEELLLVKGVSPEIFFGTGKVPPEYSAGANDAAPGGLGPEFAGIRPFVTVKGEGRVNINTAGEKVLEAAFGKGRAMEILLRRETEGYFEWPMYGGAVTSRFFSIESEADVHGMKVRIRAIAEKLPEKAEARIIYFNDNAAAVN